jgi:hypothetical protein
MKYARIVDSTVVEVFTPPNGFALADCFHPDLAVQYEPCPEHVEQRWTKNADGSFSEPLPLPGIAEPDLPA